MICIPADRKPSTGSSATGTGTGSNYNNHRYYAPSQQVVVAVRGGSVNESSPLSLSFEAAVKAYLKNPTKNKCPLPSNAREEKYLDGMFNKSVEESRKNLENTKTMGIRVLQLFAVFVPLALFISIYKFMNWVNSGLDCVSVSLEKFVISFDEAVESFSEAMSNFTVWDVFRFVFDQSMKEAMESLSEAMQSLSEAMSEVTIWI